MKTFDDVILENLTKLENQIKKLKKEVKEHKKLFFKF